MVTVLAVGDVLVNREKPDSMFSYVAETIRSLDVSFCQLETNYSELGSPSPHARLPMRAHPRNATALKVAGFDVMSFTSNHALDWGVDAFFDTIKRIESIGVKIIGVGHNIEEARKPLILDVRGCRLAFLAYGSILPAGYWAESDKPGCAPLRAWTFYEQIETDQPGTPPRIHTFAHEGDKAFMIEDIKRAKADSDIVIVSMHWGIHFTEAELAAYQKEAGHAVIDAGADVVIGHHSHILKPIEIYRGKPIFYSLGNFAFDLPLSEKVLHSPQWRELMELNSSWSIDPEYKSYPFPKDSRMTIACKIVILKKKIAKISFLPGLINKYSQPRFLGREEKEFHQVLKYIKRINSVERIETRFEVEEDQVVIMLDPE